MCVCSESSVINLIKTKKLVLLYWCTAMVFELSPLHFLLVKIQRDNLPQKFKPMLHVLHVTTNEDSTFLTHNGGCWTTRCRWLWCQQRRPEPKHHCQPGGSKCGCTTGSTNPGKHKCHYEEHILFGLNQIYY